MSLCVCLSDCPHALIGRQPSRDVTSSILYKVTEGGGQRIAATAQQPRAVGIAATAQQPRAV